MNRILTLLASALAVCCLFVACRPSARAGVIDVMNMPAGQTSLQFVTVGDPGNAPDTTVMNDQTTGYGAVSYVYRIGKYDVTAAQYAVFLNAVAATDTYGLYNKNMVNANVPSVAAGIIQSGSPGSYSYSIVAGHENFPINYLPWGAAARFVNWLQNGQPMGAEGPGTTETGAYSLNGATSSAALMAVVRNSNAKFFIPSEDEWYKAAYYKGGGTSAGYWVYPTQSNTVPSNVLSASGTNNANFGHSSLSPVGLFVSSPGPYGAFDQGGDVFQWNEAKIGTEFRGYRGGAFNLGSTSIASSSRDDEGVLTYDGGAGLRVASNASVPEPSAFVMVIAAVALPSARRLHRKADKK
jgi:sulfatase modifying factor 1